MSITTASPAPATTQPLLPLIIIAVGGGLTGFSGILMRFSEVGPLATGAWRLSLAALMLMPFLAAGDVKPGKGGLPLLCLAGLCFAIDIGFYHLALERTSIAHSTLIINLAPVIALGAGALMFGERLGVTKLTALVIALGGATMMTAMRAEGVSTLEGNGLAVIGLLGYAFYLIIVKKARHRHDTVAIMFWSSLSAGLALFAAAALAGENMLPATLQGWAVVIAMGVVTHLLGQGLIAFGMREAPIGLGSILLLTQPLIAAIGAWVIFAERLSAAEMAGAGLVLLGLVIASQARR